MIYWKFLKAATPVIDRGYGEKGIQLHLFGKAIRNIY